ncbi:MAG: hypothetical protein M1814_003747 [Vezdaea aestivalis]|nr:MAG: hypothetical protein M1814_003747 [Vezdaea aestivalis]
MDQRFQKGLSNNSTSPAYEGILGTLEACYGHPQGPINFGSDTTAQVVIKWVDITTTVFYLPVEVLLCDADESVLLRAEKTGNGYLEALERHPLLDYGTAMLRKKLAHYWLNDNSPVFNDCVQLVVAVAILSLKSLHRNRQLASTLAQTESMPDESKINLATYRDDIDLQQILTTSQVLFSSIPIVIGQVQSYYTALKDAKNLVDAYPSSLRGILKQNFAGNPKRDIETTAISGLAKLVVLFSHVAKIANCSEAPLILSHELENFFDLEDALSDDDNGYRPTFDHKSTQWLSPLSIFNAVHQLLDSSPRNEHSEAAITTFLISKYGWSLFLSSVGNNDPAEVRPEMVHIKRGVPMVGSTQEQVRQLRDLRITTGHLANDNIVGRGTFYTPECVSSVSCRKEFWTPRTNELLLHIQYIVNPGRGFGERTVDRWRKLWERNSGYRALHERLWEALNTVQCPHYSDGTLPSVQRAVLSPDAATVTSLFQATREREDGSRGGNSASDPAIPERILIVLVKGDARARWLALVQSERAVMLRTSDCCEDCALEQTSMYPGYWTLII